MSDETTSLGEIFPTSFERAPERPDPGVGSGIHDLLADHPWIRTAPFTYVRFHGPDALEKPYHGRYTGRRLRPIADRLAEWLDDGTAVFAYFNNDVDAHAVTDARWLRDNVR